MTLVNRPLATFAYSPPLLHELAQRGKAWDVPEGPHPSAGLTPLTPECLVPILGRDSRLIGLLILGERLSEEPYSGEDKSLLDSVPSQVGITLENIGLAEKMLILVLIVLALVFASRYLMHINKP